MYNLENFFNNNLNNSLTNYDYITFDLAHKQIDQNKIDQENVSVTLSQEEGFAPGMFNNEFLFDSGASISIVNDSSLISDLEERSTLVRGIGDKTVISRGRGYLLFNGHKLDCLYVPENTDNIISVNQLHRFGYGVFSLKTHMILIKLASFPDDLIEKFMNYLSNVIDRNSNDSMILPYTTPGYLPFVRLDSKEQNLKVNSNTTKTNTIENIENISCASNSLDYQSVEGYEDMIHIVSKLDFSKIDLTLNEVPDDDVFRLHCALGHMHYKSMIDIGISLSNENILSITRCKTCKVAKFTLKNTKHHKDHTSTKPFEQLHLDTAGPIRAVNMDYYIVLIIDDYSRYLKIIVTKQKSKIKEEVLKYIEDETKTRGYCPRFLTTDKGVEFKGLGFEIVQNYDYQPKDMREFPYLNVAPTGNKQYNGLAERTVRTLKTIEQLLVSHLHPFYQEKYIEFAFKYAALLYNRSPHSGIDKDIPLGRYFKRRAKLASAEDVREKEVFIGSQPAHMFLNIQRTLPQLPMFLEDGCYPKQVKGKTVLEECFYVGYDENDCILVMRKQKSRKYETLDKTTQFVRFGTFKLHQGGLLENKINQIYSLFSAKVPFTETTNHEIGTDFNSQLAIEKINSLTSLETNLPPMIIPKNFQEACQRIEWLEAINKEIASFMKHQVYKTTKGRVANAKYLHTFWLFTRKVTGEAKARLITIDPKTVGHRDTEASSPVVRLTTLFLMFVKFGLVKDLHFTVSDIGTAFLNSKVPENEIYLLRTPLGFQSMFKSKYVQMLKYSYGLNISPLKFLQTLSQEIDTVSNRSATDKCLHASKAGQTSDWLVAHHVDDLLVLSNNPEPLLTVLQNKFTIKISRDPEFYLGYDFHQTQDILTLSFSTYLEKAVAELPEVLQKAIKVHSTNPFNSDKKNIIFPKPKKEVLKPLLTTIENEDDETKFSDEAAEALELPPLALLEIDLTSVQPPTTEQRNQHNNGTFRNMKPLPIDQVFSVKTYQSLTGRIAYLASKGRFDIKGYSSFLSQFNSMPTIREFRQAIHLLQYCYATRYSYLKFEKENTTIGHNDLLNLDIYTDASNPEDSSQGGYFILLNGYLLDYKSYRISHKTRSSFEAELIALTRGVVQALKLIPSIKDIGYKKLQVTAYCDNEAVITRVKSQGEGDLLTQIYRNCLNYLRYEYELNNFALNHIDGKINPADLLTKPLDSYKLFSLLQGSILKKTFSLQIGKPKSTKE